MCARAAAAALACGLLLLLLLLLTTWRQVFKLAKKGVKPSQIGIILRDQEGVGLIQRVTGQKIFRILKAKGALWAPGGAECASPRAFCVRCELGWVWALIDRPGAC